MYASTNERTAAMTSGRPAILSSFFFGSESALGLARFGPSAATVSTFAFLFEAFRRSSIRLARSHRRSTGLAIHAAAVKNAIAASPLTTRASDRTIPSAAGRLYPCRRAPGSGSVSPTGVAPLHVFALDATSFANDTASLSAGSIASFLRVTPSSGSGPTRVVSSVRSACADRFRYVTLLPDRSFTLDSASIARVIARRSLLPRHLRVPATVRARGIRGAVVVVVRVRERGEGARGGFRGLALSGRVQAVLQARRHGRVPEVEPAHRAGRARDDATARDESLAASAAVGSSTDGTFRDGVRRRSRKSRGGGEARGHSTAPMGACLSSGSDPVSDPHSRERERYNRELEETANTLRVRAATRSIRREMKNGRC